jgi:PAS domain S-box-containing protein
VLALDRAGRVVGLNDAATRMLGFAAGAVRGQPFADVALDEQQRGGFAEVIRLVLDGVSWNGELPLRRADGSGTSDVHVVPVATVEAVTGAILVAEGVTGRRDRAVLLSQRMTRLARVVAELLYAEDLEAVTDIVVHRMADAAGATTASLSLLVDDETLQLLKLRGGSDAAAARWSTYSIHDANPASEVVRTRAPVVVSGSALLATRYPDLGASALSERSLVCLPLPSGPSRSAWPACPSPAGAISTRPGWSSSGSWRPPAPRR